MKTVVTGWISDGVLDPEQLAPSAHEYVCRACRLVLHRFTHAGDGTCRDCTTDRKEGHASIARAS